MARSCARRAELPRGEGRGQIGQRAGLQRIRPDGPGRGQRREGRVTGTHGIHRTRQLDAGHIVAFASDGERHALLPARDEHGPLLTVRQGFGEPEGIRGVRHRGFTEQARGLGDIELERHRGKPVGMMPAGGHLLVDDHHRAGPGCRFQPRQQPRPGLRGKRVLPAEINPVELRHAPVRLGVDQGVPARRTAEDPVAADPAGGELRNQFVPEQVGAHQPDQVHVPDAERRKVRRHIGRAPRRVPGALHLVRRQPGLDRDFLGRRVEQPVRIEAQVAEHRHPRGGQAGQQAVEPGRIGEVLRGVHHAPTFPRPGPLRQLNT